MISDIAFWKLLFGYKSYLMPIFYSRKDIDGIAISSYVLVWHSYQSVEHGGMRTQDTDETRLGSLDIKRSACTYRMNVDTSNQRHTWPNARSQPAWQDHHMPHLSLHNDSVLEMCTKSKHGFKCSLSDSAFLIGRGSHLLQIQICRWQAW